MAAKADVNSCQTDFEFVVNRWLVDYYLFRALKLFQNEQYADFFGIRDILGSVMARPMEVSDTMPTKIRVLQFLCRISEGENLDMCFESDQSITPLESALFVLEEMNKESVIPQQDFQNVCTSLKEMAVGMLIKNKGFDKAKELLNKHFPKPMVGKKAIFMGLIRQKSNTHEVIEQIDLQRFKQDMLAFCQRMLCPFDVPFLLKTAKQLVDRRLAAEDDKAARADEQNEPASSSNRHMITVQFAPCKYTIINKTRLERAYRDMSSDSGGRPFAQLEDEVQREEQTRKGYISLHLSPSPKNGTDQDSGQEGLFQRDSGSPMEAALADQPPQTDAVPKTQAGSHSKTPSVLNSRSLYTVARLVVEPDSQWSSQCTSASQELETEVRTEEPPLAMAVPNKRDLQNPIREIEVTKPIRRRPRRANKTSSRASTSLAELSADSEEDPPGNKETRVEKLHDQSNSSFSRKSPRLSQSSSHSEGGPTEPLAPGITPVQKTQPASDFPSRDAGNTEEIHITDSSLDSSPTLCPLQPVPQTSSTPHKDSSQGKDPSYSKWKRLYNNATESKAVWSDEDSYFTTKKKSRSHEESTISNSGHRKKMWTESETQKLKDGVKRFGEGNWSKIHAYYSFKDRTNINLKDRWRTLKKLNMV